MIRTDQIRCLLPLKLALIVSVAWLSCLGYAQARDIYVDMNHSSGQNSCTAGTPQQPILSVAQAVQCATDPALTSDVRIIVLCTLAAGFCDYDLPNNNTFLRHPNSSTSITLRGEPYQMVRFQQQYIDVQPPPNPNPNKPIIIQDRWTIHGVVFDGMRSTSEQGGGAFVRLQGNDITFTHNEISNTAYTCLGIVNGGDQTAVQHQNLHITHNYIHDCHPSQASWHIDRMCIYNRIARNVFIAYNDITQCGGDGYAIENYKIGNTNPDFPQLAEVALSNHIIGNRFYTSCMNNVSWGENAIDVKRAGQDLIIRDNVMWGYRQAFDKSVPCHGTGSGDVGYAIVVHGQLEDANGSKDPSTGFAVADGPLCMGTIGRCATIEGNDISNTQAGMAIGSDGDYPVNSQGKTRGVDVRGNYIHDLRGVTGSGIESWKRGFGLSLATPDAPASTIPPSAYNRVYRNVIANTPGDSFYVGSRASVTPNEFAWTFAVRNNFIGWNGYASDGSIATACNNHLGQYPIDHESNYWNNALSPLNPPYNEISANIAPPFLKSLPTTRPLCGDTSLQMPDSPNPFLGLRYDYRIKLSIAEFSDRGGNDPAFGERHSDMLGKCGTSYDIGPDEHCGNDFKVFLRENSDPSTNPDAELFTHPVWWDSPDIGIWDGIQALPTDANLPLPAVRPYFSNNGTTNYKLLLRIRSNSAPSNGEAVTVRIWGAPIHTSISFPREFTPYVDMPVTWSSADPQYVAHGTSGATSWYLYAFDWNVTGAFHPRYQNEEHFCLKAEISAKEDWRPPFMTAVEQSNNLAQRNVAIVREPASTSNFLFRVAQSEEPIVLNFNVAMPEGNAVMLFVPKSSASVLTRDKRGRIRTPADYEPYAENPTHPGYMGPGQFLELPRGKRRIAVQIPKAQGNTLQLVITHRASVPKKGKNEVAVDQIGASGFRIIFDPGKGGKH